jgi:hypothetical protein
MANRWIEFVKKYANENNISYTCAMCEIKTKGLYKPLNKQETKEDIKTIKIKQQKAKKEIEYEDEEEAEYEDKEKEEIEDLIFKKLEKKKEEIIKEMEEIERKPKRKGELSKANREAIFGLEIQLERNQQEMNFFIVCIKNLKKYREKLKEIEEMIEERKRKGTLMNLNQLNSRDMYKSLIYRCEKALTNGVFEGLY